MTFARLQVNVRGKSKDRECDNCRSPLRPLFTSFFCPNDCDRDGGESRVISWGGRRFRMKRVSQGERLPAWAESAWNFVDSTKRDDPSLTLDQLAEAWNDYVTCQYDEKQPGWLLSNHGMKISCTRGALVFSAALP